MPSIGTVTEAPIIDEMKRSYLDYAMSVIVSRALPDVKDGLKPVQRRIIYAMHQQGMHHSSRYQKSAAVVGEVLKNYHPHGDVPVYDALVRMAQDFTMRYTLVDGQGNFGCFTKDTKIKLTDGRNITFAELENEQNQGKKHWGFSFNKDSQKIEITELIKARLTRRQASLVKVVLDNGEIIQCTPDHRFLKKNGTYIEALNLKPGDSLMPAYFNINQIKVKHGHLRYLSVLQQSTNKYEFVHKLADEYNQRQNLHNKIAKGYLLHHKDFNRWNNSPDNIVRLTWKQHYEIHLKQVKTLWGRKGDEFRDKHRESLRKVFSNPKMKIKLSLSSKSNWQNPKYRNKFPQDHFRSMAKKLWQDPEMIKFHRDKIQKQRQDPNFIRKSQQAVRLADKRRIKENPTMMRDMAQLAALSLHKKWAEPHYSRRVIKSKILRHVSSLIARYPKVTPQLYEKWRINNGTPKINKAILYFSNFNNILNQARTYNHKVLRVIKLTGRQDVYDLTTEPWHNFLLSAGVFVHNSQDGDPAAASRYTEARLDTISDELLRDISKNTVEFIDNYSATTKEPTVLPAVIPNLLLNGASGIAVGMATQIPPHNLGEVIEALNYMVEHPVKPSNGQVSNKMAKISEEEVKFTSNVSVEDLVKFIKGPDFPTGASIYDQSEIINAYATGKGRILMRAKAEIEEAKGGRFDIIITELPYQVNKAMLVAKIADLHKEKKVEGIADLRDESDRRGMRVVIELKRDSQPQSVLNKLYKFTAMQSVFNVNMVALVDGVPRLLPLKYILEEFISHRQILIRRRSEFELEEAKKRAHILEGLKIAVDHVDAVIKTIRESRDADEAKKNLMEKFKLTEIQAVAILDMQLRRLAALERQKIEDELKMVREEITYLEDLLAHPEKILQVVKNELTKIKERYQDPRRTRVYKQKVGDFSEEDLVADETTIVTITENGYIKRQPPTTFRVQARGGKGVSGMSTKEEDAVSHLFYTKTLDNILFFTDKGRVFQLRVWEIPEASRISKGQAIVNLINVEQGEKITAVLTIRQKDKVKFLLMCTKAGTVKKTPIEEYASIRRNGLVSIKLDSGDTLGWVAPTTGNDDLIIVSRDGQSIRFNERDVKDTHRDTSGVRGILLKKTDSVVSLNRILDKNNNQLLTIMENGLGKKTPVSAWSNQKRGGMGVKAAQVNQKTGPIVTAQIVEKDGEMLVLTSNKGQIIKLNMKDVPTLQRQTQGVILMRSRVGEKVAAATVVSSKEKDDSKD